MASVASACLSLSTRPLAARRMRRVTTTAASSTPPRRVHMDDVTKSDEKKEVPAVHVLSRRDALASSFVAIAGLASGPALASGVPPELECAEALATAASGLQFCDAAVGEGGAPSAGGKIKAHYTGRLTDGRVFDSSYSRGKPLEFKVGVGQVIRYGSSGTS